MELHRLQQEHKQLIYEVYDILVGMEILNPVQVTFIDWLERCKLKAVEMEAYENAAMIVKFIKQEEKALVTLTKKLRNK